MVKHLAKQLNVWQNEQENLEIVMKGCFTQILDDILDANTVHVKQACSQNISVVGEKGPIALNCSLNL